MVRLEAGCGQLGAFLTPKVAADEEGVWAGVDVSCLTPFILKQDFRWYLIFEQRKTFDGEVKMHFKGWQLQIPRGEENPRLRLNTVHLICHHSSTGSWYVYMKLLWNPLMVTCIELVWIVKCCLLPITLIKYWFFYHGFLSNQFINGWSFFDTTAIAESVM